MTNGAGPAAAAVPTADPAEVPALAFLVAAWASIVGASLVGLFQLSALLGRLVAQDGPSFPLTSIIRPRFTVTDSDPIARAVLTWIGPTGDNAELVRYVFAWHVGVDTFVLVPSIGVLLFRWVRSGPGWAVPSAFAAGCVLSDLLENGCLWWLATHDLTSRVAEHPSFAVQMLPVMSLSKWSLLALGLMAGVIRRRDQLTAFRRILAPARAGVVVAGMTVALLAMPGGGPLEQLPDIVRAQVLPGQDGALVDRLLGTPFVVPLVASVLLAVLVWIANDLTVSHIETSTPSNVPRKATAAVTAVALGVILMLLTWLILPHHGFIVTAGTSAAIGLLVLFGVALALGNGGFTDLASYGASDFTRARYVGIGCCCVIAAAPGLSMVRAFAELSVGARGTFPVENADAATDAFVVGVVLTVLLPMLVLAILRILSQSLVSANPHVTVVVALVGLVLLGVWLATADPRPALALEPQGVVFVGLGILLLAWSLLDATPRVYQPGTWLRQIGWQRRPVGLALLALLVAPSTLSHVVAYHAVQREAPSESALPAGSPDLSNSACLADLWACTLEAWAANLDGCLSSVPGVRPDHPLPLVLVAAPGGGIRAAYWTALGLDAIARQPCGEEMVFAISGVSGGSVGATTWVGVGGGTGPQETQDRETSDPDPSTAPEQIGDMGRTGPLSRDMAALLFRDLPIGLSGMHPPIRDRAEILEDAWEESAPSLSTPLGALRGSAGWQPHLLLNATDVQRGCRVLATTLPEAMTSGLVASQDVYGQDEARVEVDPRRCTSLTERLDNIAVSGNRPPVAFAVGTTDVRHISTSQAPCSDADTEAQDLPSSAAAHLSARFPIVSPSGGFVVCRAQDKLTGSPDHDQVQVGDGGYRENTGLSTLLEMWRPLGRAVEEHNDRPGARPVTPTIVLLDNHYRSSSQADSPHRLGELMVPMRGTSARESLGSEPVLEQSAINVMTAAQPAVPIADARRCVGWLVLAPQQNVSVTAPLGWVLSSQSRASLRTEFSAIARRLNELGACALGERFSTAAH